MAEVRVVVGKEWFNRGLSAGYTVIPEDEFCCSDRAIREVRCCES